MVTLTIPKWASVQQAEVFLRDQSIWIAKALAQLPEELRSRDIDELRAHYEQHKEDARKLIRRWLPELNTEYDFQYNRIAIRHNRSRWGSCSANGNLNFDYRILFLPEHLQEYILVHELCHLGELNHSQRFWDLVAERIPDYIERRKELRGYNMTSLV